jgi:hypothetical protein
MARDLEWTAPVLRAVYPGRGLVYLAVAGFSLWAIWQGGSADGTESALAKLENSAWGKVVLVGIALGLAAYAAWRVIDAWFDLERHGTEAKGLVARAGMVVTGLIHLALGVAAVSALLGGGGGGGGESSLASAASTVMGWPGGRWLVGLAGLLTLGAAAYYGQKAWKASYRSNLYGNEPTRRFNTLLRIGVAAQAVILGIVGGFLVIAALRHNPNEAGGMGEVFDWLAAQPFGNVLVVALCLGLLAFAFFLFVNAAYRIIPALADDKPMTLKAALG